MEVGCLEGVVEKYFAGAMDRRIKHPAIKTIVEHAQNRILGG
jgi:hypothetical protein